MKKELKQKFVNILPFVAFFLLLLTFHQKIRAFDSDDAYFSDIQNKYSLSEFLIHRYNEWSGRLTVEAALYIVRDLDIRWWRLINSFVITGLCIILVMLVLGNEFWLINDRRTTRTIWFACIGIGLLNIQILGPSMFWITGSFNYLWPITAAFLVFIPFRERLSNEISHLTIKSAIWYIFPVLAAVFAGLGNEQVSLILLGLTILFDIVYYKTRKKIEPLLIIITLISIGSFIMLWTAPGNRIRYEQEIITWFPNFKELSLGEHIFITARWMLDKIINVNRILMILLFGMIAMSFTQKTTSKVEKRLAYSTAMLAAFLLISSLNIEILHPNMQIWFEELFFAFRPIENFISAYAKLERNMNFFLFFIPYILWIPVIVSTPYLIYRSWQDNQYRGLLLSTLFCVALFSLILMAFSPTIIASANRTIAIFSIVLWFILINYFHQLSDQIPTWILIPVYIVALCNLVFQYIEWKGAYLIHW